MKKTENHIHLQIAVLPGEQGDVGSSPFVDPEDKKTPINEFGVKIPQAFQNLIGVKVKRWRSACGYPLGSGSDGFTSRVVMVNCPKCAETEAFKKLVTEHNERV
jgi:hypothetical protein